MILDIRYVSSTNNLFEGLITESIENLIGMENNFFQNSYNSDSIKAEKEGSLELGRDFLAENEELNLFYLKNDFGSIDLKGSENQEIRIDYTLKVHAEDKNAAEEFIKGLEVIYDLEGEEIRVDLNESQTDTPELINVVEIDYEITIPNDFKTELINKYGQLNMSDLKAELRADNRYGSMLVENIEAAVEVELDYGKSEIYNLASTLELKTSYSENIIKDVAGEFDLESAYGFTKIENIDSALSYNSRYGGAEITSAADIDLNSRYTGISFRDIAGKISADIEYGEIRLNRIADLDLDLKYSDCIIESLRDYELYNYNIQVEYGNIEADFLEAEDYDNNYLSYQGTRAEYEIEINSEYADVEIN
jgi:hypothetical protein